MCSKPRLQFREGPLVFREALLLEAIKFQESHPTDFLCIPLDALHTIRYDEITY